MRFNVRVYGLLIKESCVLISEEWIKGQWIRKFPGGGLEFGEGTRDCLKREFTEELSWDIDIGNHFYTTDFYVKSAYDESQVISIYYTVTPARIGQILPDNTDTQRYVWMPIHNLERTELSLVIDQKVAQLLHTQFGQLP